MISIEKANNNHRIKKDNLKLPRMFHTNKNPLTSKNPQK